MFRWISFLFLVALQGLNCGLSLFAFTIQNISIVSVNLTLLRNIVLLKYGK